MTPVAGSERYRFLDVLRGIALFGVLMINLLSAFRVSLFQHILTPHSDPGWANYTVDWIAAELIEFKALTLFSFLFGVGVAIQMERRATAWSLFFLRRFGALLLIGLVHLYLIWNGDILALYGVCGLLIIPLLRLPTMAIAVIGVAVIGLSPFVSIPLALPGEEALKAHAALANATYTNGSFLEILNFRIHEVGPFILPLFAGTLLRTVGLMLCGIAAWRSGLLREPRRNRKALIATLVTGTVIGVVAIAGRFDAISILPMSCAYAAAVLLIADYLPAPFAALGQMALTNYLTQSVVLGVIFYGYGLGLLGKLGSAPAALIGIALYASQLVFSQWWLRRYRYGPVEWLWRSITYGRMRSLEFHGPRVPVKDKKPKTIP